MASDTRSVRHSRQRGDAPADAGRAGDPAVPTLARAPADRGHTRRGECCCGCGRRHSCLAGVGLQPAGAEPSAGGAAGRGRGLAGRSDRAPRSWAVHGRGDRELRAGPGRAARRHECHPCTGPHGPALFTRGGPGADGSRRNGLPRTRPAVRDLSARLRLPLARTQVRGAAEAVPLRRLVPTTPRADVAPRGGVGASVARSRRRSSPVPGP